MNQDLRYSLIILKRINNQLHHAEEALRYIARQMQAEYDKRPIDQKDLYCSKTSMYCIVYYMHMWYASFLEEYEKLISRDIAFKDPVIKARRGAQPHLDTLAAIFDDIRSARNLVLAHPYRDGSHAQAKAISDKQFNELHDRMSNHPNIDPYTQIGNCIRLTIQELEKVLGKIDESEVIGEEEADMLSYGDV